MVLLYVHVKSSKSSYVEFKDSIGKFSSNDSELGLADLPEVSASCGLIFSILGTLVIEKVSPQWLKLRFFVGARWHFEGQITTKLEAKKLALQLRSALVVRLASELRSALMLKLSLVVKLPSWFRLALVIFIKVL